MTVGLGPFRVRLILQRLWWSTRSLLIALAFGIFFLAVTFPSEKFVNPEQFEQSFGPQKDYLSTEEKFVGDGDCGAAINLGDFVRENPDLPHAQEIIALRDRAEQEYNSWWSRTKRVASGFLTGNTDSSQGMAGDFAANLLVYGNVRDLAKQSYNKVTGQAVDRPRFEPIGEAGNFARIIARLQDAGIRTSSRGSPSRPIGPGVKVKWARGYSVESRKRWAWMVGRRVR